MIKARALSRFALAAAGSKTDPEILVLALELLGELFAVTGAVGVMHAEGGLRVVVARGLDGELSIGEDDSPALIAAIEAAPTTPLSIIDPAAPLARWFDRAHPGLQTSSTRRSVVLFRMTGLLREAPDVLLCRTEAPAGSETTLATEADLPFLSDFLRHLEVALGNSRAHFDLERQIETRTSQLAATNEALSMRLTELRTTQRQLVDASRRAGMTEVAIHVLHNVGNALNSLTTSASVIADVVSKSKIPAFEKAAGLLAEQPDRARFLAEDPRAPRLLDYITAVAGALGTERSRLTTELDALQASIAGIQSLIEEQRAYVTQIEVRETVAIADVIGDALAIHAAAVRDRKVTLVREAFPAATITIDRYKLVQVVIDLIGAALDAVERVPAPRIVVRARRDDEHVAIEVQDNGPGLTAEETTAVFVQRLVTVGGRTRRDLHATACAAIELHARLAAHSDGPGRGTRFELVLPVGPG